MALSLANLYNNAVDVTPLTNRVSAAACIAAQGVLTEDPGIPQHAARLAWAQKTLLDPQAMGKKMIWGVLADNNVIAAIPGVSDAILQTATTAVVNSYLNA